MDFEIAENKEEVFFFFFENKEVSLIPTSLHTRGCLHSIHSIPPK
jgi:hypothetical protein